jgi:hypothetical protein
MARVVAFEDRSGHFVFVPAPGEYGRWIRTARVVALVGCPACGAEAGVPCVGQYGRHTGSSHADRHVAGHAAGVTFRRGRRTHQTRIEDEDIADDQEAALSPEADAMARWLSACLEDPGVCDEMKRDVRAWFETLEARPRPTESVDLREVLR